jgi:hypothetical protein
MTDIEQNQREQIPEDAHGDTQPDPRGNTTRTYGSIGQEIVQTLGETNPRVIDQIFRLIRFLGVEQAQALFAETQQTEANGGMMLPDGSRRRTPGGVFFQLARKYVPEDQHARFFNSPRHKRGARPKPADSPESNAPATPKPASSPHSPQPTTAFTWAERGPLITEARTAQGVVKTVKVTLIGRPAKTVERNDFTLLLMKHSGPLPALPKGVPVPTKVPETSYVVYIGAKQWKSVKEALQNPDDTLIIEGAQFYDKEYEAIAVFATNTTTKQLQQAKRQSTG